MKKVLYSVCAIAASAMILSSCAMVSTPAGMGGLFTNVTAPGAVTSNPVGNKVGTAKASNILGIICTGDCSINAAAKNGGVKKISHVDQIQKSVLGIVASSETVVYGE